MLEPGGGLCWVSLLGVFAHRGSCVAANVFVWVLGVACVSHLCHVPRGTAGGYTLLL